MKPKDFIPYLRASTEGQGKDGLGIDSQRANLRDFIAKEGGNMLQEFVDIESGAKNHNMQGFKSAIALAKETGATIVVNDMSRLARSGYYMAHLLSKENVKYIEWTSPGDDSFTKDIKFAMAKEERMRIKSKTKDALRSIKRKIERDGHHISKAGRMIESLGKPENFSNEGRKKGRKTLSDRAKSNPRNIRAKAMAKILKEEKRMSLSEIAQYLNDNGYLTSSGKKFYAMSVSRVLRI